MKAPIKIEYGALLDEDAEALVAESAADVLEKEDLWHSNRVEPRVLHLIGLDRLGGEAGHGGSRVFVGYFSGGDAKGAKRSSVPLLLKVVERNRNRARTLHNEQQRYEAVRGFLNENLVARCLNAYRSTDGALAVLWGEFFSDRTSTGMPELPQEFRHQIERRHWGKARETVKAAYEILGDAHTEEARIEDIRFLDEYREYLREDEGCEWLAASLPNTARIDVMGVSVRNPCQVLRRLRANPAAATGKGLRAAVHGDLHPRNIMVGSVTRACLIDWGWANADFHVIVDFVLMELSVKFFYLPWHLRRDEVVHWERRRLASWDEPILAAEGCVRGADPLIRIVRKLAKPHIVEPTKKRSLALQYMLPLFLVTMGTFTFAQRVANLDHLILSAGLLAERVESELLL